MPILLNKDYFSTQMHDDEKIRQEILKEAINDKMEKKNAPRPLFYLLIFFMIIIAFSLIVPLYLIDPSPEPRNIPRADEILPDQPKNSSISRPDSNDLRAFAMVTPLTKMVATKIVTGSCPTYDELCYSKALFYFTQRNFQYVQEKDEYYQTPFEMMYSGGGDCDDFSILLASLHNSVGIPVRFIKIPRHVYVQAYIKDAPSRLKTDDGWIDMDATCIGCRYGEIPNKNIDMPKEVIWR